MPRVLVLRPSAKINLTLHVGAAARDGFHDVRTLLQSVALSDTLTVTARCGPFTLASAGPGVPADRDKPGVARGRSTLAGPRSRRRTARRAREAREADSTAAGLGGGSADAAAALVGLNMSGTGDGRGAT